MKKDAPCVRAERGSITVNGCDFLDNDPAKNHIELGKELEDAVIMGRYGEADEMPIEPVRGMPPLPRYDRFSGQHADGGAEG